MGDEASKKMGWMTPRFFSKAALFVTILPLWALWIYAYASLKSVGSEVEALPRFYGMYLYKQHLRERLEGAARAMRLWREEGREGVGGGEGEGLSEEDRERIQLFFGPEETLIVVDRRGPTVLYPDEPPYGEAVFLGEPEGREAFLRTLQRMDLNSMRGGYLSIDTDAPLPSSSGKGSWFLALAPVAGDLVLVLPVPEEQVRLSGGILEEAQADLLRQGRTRFVRRTFPIVVLSSLFIGILYRQARSEGRGREGHVGAFRG